mmetsp:Transcript_36549/g.56113  ORF Transcript_36549/g.56113 Transcript_36549/m.56113 type:complete len:166 (+) Transcript_36549:47-544(+)
MYNLIKKVDQDPEHHKKKDDDGKKNKKKKAIIIRYDVNYGSCELETYSLADASKAKFSVEMTCLEGLILLSMNYSGATKTPRELSNHTGLTIYDIKKGIANLVKKSMLISTENDSTCYRVNPDFNNGSYKTERISFLKTKEDKIAEDEKFLSEVGLDKFAEVSED